MARRAVETAAPQSPPKRITRARTRNIAAATAGVKDDIKAKTKPNESTSTAPRGRPRKNSAESTATSSKLTTTRTKPTGRVGNNADTVPKTRAGRTTKAKTAINDMRNERGESSDDEVDVVTVRSNIGTRSTGKGIMASSISSTGSSTGGVRKSAPRPIRKQTPVNEQYDDCDDDDDELAGSQPAKQKASRLRPGATSTAARKVKASSAPKATKPAPRRQKKMPEPAAPESGSSSVKSTPHGASSSLSGSTGGLAKAKPTGKVKKKVTFLDITENSDKENQPLPASAVDRKKTRSESGLSAKPVRKGANSVVKEKPSPSANKNESKKEPLSPKKATQVAKSGSSGSSDDCADDDDINDVSVTKSPVKSPVKPANRSPTKVTSMSSVFESPAKRLNFNPSEQQAQTHGDNLELPPNETDQVLFKETVIGESSARRPPSSPYKDAMKETPKRAQLFRDAKLLGESEMSQNIRISPLKESPRKGKLGPYFSQLSIATTPNSPTKERLSPLKSPAKRPPSPIKFPQPSLPSFPTLSTFSPASSPASSPQANIVTDDPKVQEDISLHLNATFELEDDASCSKDASPVPNDFSNGGLSGFEESMLDVSELLPARDEESNDNRCDANGTESPMNMIASHTGSHDPFVTTAESPVISTPSVRYETIDSDSSVGSFRNFRDIPPPAPSPPVFSGGSSLEFIYRDNMYDEESETESMMENSPTKSGPMRTLFDMHVETPGIEDRKQNVNGEKLGFTPLAEKLSHWVATSPEKQPPKRQPQRGLFSPSTMDNRGRRSVRDSLEARPSLRVRHSLASRHSIDTNGSDQMEIIENEIASEQDQYTLRDESIEHLGDMVSVCTFEGTEEEEHEGSDINTIDIFEQSECAEDYGDENTPPEETTVPIDPQIFEEEWNESVIGPKTPPHHPPLPMSVTPVRSGSKYPRTIHTVSKVPLRPASDGSLSIPRKRSRSLSAGPNRSTPTFNRSKILPSPRRSQRIRSPTKVFEPNTRENSSRDAACALPERPKMSTWSGCSSPIKSPKKSIPESELVLQGAVVYVDVHTAEGADASGIFVELLTQMGARCVKSWNWNPRSSLSPVDGVEPREAKVGITHVVYKDGGVRTLEKIRETNGLVKCVGVGWVLDCERQTKWVDEANYTVDVTMIPRGGSKRRKSMEPRALSNKNGTLIKLGASNSSASGRRGGADSETMQDFMRNSPTPTSPLSLSRDSLDAVNCGSDNLFASPSTHRQQRKNKQPAQFKTPTKPSSRPTQDSNPTTPIANSNFTFDFDATPALSPTTPYYLTEGAKLIQQTCPPKQSGQGLFPISGDIEEREDERLKMRLEAARRRSLVWKPKVGSPLRKQSA